MLIWSILAHLWRTYGAVGIKKSSNFAPSNDGTEMNKIGLAISSALALLYWKKKSAAEETEQFAGLLDDPTIGVSDSITHGFDPIPDVEICPGLVVEYVGNRLASYKSDFDALGYVTFAKKGTKPIYIFKIEVDWELFNQPDVEHTVCKLEDTPIVTYTYGKELRRSYTGKTIEFTDVQIGGTQRLVGLSGKQIKAIKENINKSQMSIADVICRASVIVWWGENKDDWKENRAKRWDALNIPCKMVSEDNLRGIMGNEILAFKNQFKA